MIKNLVNIKKIIILTSTQLLSHFLGVKENLKKVRDIIKNLKNSEDQEKRISIQNR